MRSYYSMTYIERDEFCKRHNIDRFPTIIELAENDLVFMKTEGPIDDLSVYIAPLKELGEDLLLDRLLKMNEWAKQNEAK